MDEKVSIEGLKEVSVSLNEKRNKIGDIYNRELYPLIRDFYCTMDAKYGEAKLASYNALYTSINNRLNELCDLLNNGVIEDYSEIVNSTIKLFDEGFNSQIEDLLKNDEE